MNDFRLITSGESGRSNDAAGLKGGGSRSDNLSARRERPSGPQRGKPGHLSNDIHPMILRHSTRLTIPLFIVSSNRNPIDSPIVFSSVSGTIYAIFGRTKHNSHSWTRTWLGASQYPQATSPMVCLILTSGLVRFRSSDKRIHIYRRSRCPDVVVPSAKVIHSTFSNVGGKTTSPGFIAFERLIEVGPELPTDEGESRVDRREEMNVPHRWRSTARCSRVSKHSTIKAIIHRRSSS